MRTGCTETPAGQKSGCTNRCGGWKKEEKNHGTRKTQIKTWVYPAFRRLCHRHRKRMEIPLHGRPGRRRRVRAVLSAVPGHLGPAHHEHGVCSGPRQPQESGARLSGTGKAGPEMAHPRLLYPHWLLLADDVLHHRGRLDDALLLHDGCGQALRPDRGWSGKCLYRDAGKPRHHGVLDGRGGRVRHLCLCPWPAERLGACDQSHDDRSAGHHGHPGRQQPVHAGGS